MADPADDQSPAHSIELPRGRSRGVPRQLARLAGLAQSLERKRVLCTRYSEQLATLERGGIVVIAGERAMLTQLQSQLDQALLHLAELAAATPTDHVNERLNLLEDLLDGPEWTAAEMINDGLAEKLRHQIDVIDGLKSDLASWRSRIDQIGQALEAAKGAGAPITVPQRQRQRMEAQLSQAERALAEQQYAAVPGLVQPLESDTNTPESIIEELRRKLESSRPFSRQIQLLLLQSPLVNRCYQYTVLLRTPSEPGMHGINIRDSTTIVQQDRAQVTEDLKTVTRAIGRHLVRRLATGTGEPGRPPLTSIGEPTAPDDQSSTANQATVALATGAAVASANTAAPAPLTNGHGPDSAAGPANEERIGAASQAAPALAAGPRVDIIRDLSGDLTSDARMAQATLNDLVQDVGDLMYSILIPEQMQTYLADTACSLTITTNDLELPWELMYLAKKKTFLCLERPVARMPMGRAFPRDIEPVMRSGKLRFLLIYSDPTGNLPGARQEVASIKEALEREWNDQVEITVYELGDASGRMFNRVLRGGSFDVIHYTGHAGFDANDPDLSGLLLHDHELLYAQKIRRLLRGRPLVFLNACESGQTANEAHTDAVTYFQKPAEGLASAFIYGGALGCIGSIWPIYDGPAADFAVAFYRHALEGQMIGEAMRLARDQNRRDHPDQVTWASFVLYGDPTFRLVG